MEISRTLGEGVSAHFLSKHELAVSLLEKTWKALLQQIDQALFFPKILDYLLDTGIYLNLSLSLLKKKEEAREVLKKLCLIVPDKIPTVEKYGPYTVARYQEIKKELAKQPKANLKIKTNLKRCQIFLNGTPKGTSPLKLKNISVGTHIIQLKCEDKISAPKKIVIKENQEREVFIDMKFEDSIILKDIPRIKFTNKKEKTLYEVNYAKKLAKLIKIKDIIILSIEKGKRKLLVAKYLKGNSIIKAGIPIRKSPHKRDISALFTYLLDKKSSYPVVLDIDSYLWPKPQKEEIKLTKWYHDWIGWTILGSGILILGSGIGFGKAANQKRKKAMEVGDPERTNLEKQADNFSTLSTVMYTLGLVGMIKGLALLFVHQPQIIHKKIRLSLPNNVGFQIWLSW
jgi:hypothetical protein